MLITNIYFRTIFGFFSIFIGLILLKIYSEKDKDSIWGNIYRMGNNYSSGQNTRLNSGRVYLIFGCLSIVAGLIATFYGFRLYLVGN